MICYRFHEADGPGVAFTSDITGGNLPRLAAIWKADGQTDLSTGGRPRAGTASEQIIAAIETAGYFVGALSQPLAPRA